VGHSSNFQTFTYNFAIARYSTAGTLDTSFGSGGKVTTPIGNPSVAYARSVKLQTDRKIVAAGYISNSTSYFDFALVRYNINGSLDTSFGLGGKVITPVGNAEDVACAVAIQPDDKIVAAGFTNTTPSGQDFALVRYIGKTSQQQFNFDGDGKTDISIFRPSVGQWWYQQSSDNVTKAFTFGTSTDKIVPADYDGDGKTDIAFFRPSTGEWFVLRSSNLTFYSAPFGNSTDKVAPGDFDGDGKADLAVYRGSQGVWFILKSSDNGVLTVPFGISQDIPEVADYDGDGKADVAFYRPLTSEWFVLRSEDLSFYAAPFGANGDTPVAGDYDGDGKVDLAVFRPSSATWFVLKSTGGTLIQGFGVTGDIPVPSAFVP
jgi:uncharacterized delta-60 repeat protein